MDNLNTACLKISKEGKVDRILVFTFAKDRETYLLSQGFLPLDGVYRHRSGLIAGKFSANNANERLKQDKWDDIPEFHTCTTPLIQHPLMWEALLRK